MAQCTNHPGVETDTACSSCLRPFCSACLVDFLGQPHCGYCRDLKLRQMQQPGPDDASLAGTNRVELGPWLSYGAQLVQSDIATFALATLLAVLLTVFSCGICGPAAACGLYMLCFRKMTYGRAQPGDVMDGFKRFLNALLTGLFLLAVGIAIMVVISLPLSAIGVLSAGGRNSGGSPIYLFTNLGSNVLSTVVAAIIQGATLFAMPHVAARNADPVQALSASWTVFRRNPVMFVVTGFVFSLVARIGVVACCIGLLFTVPMVIAAGAKAYADHFGIRGWDQA